ncbi:MAG: hypothetical protein JXA57_02305 [Armatimonadetes bacterium]|nr:hypothetical protein [Armatimonadota bacterium]
MSEQFDKLIARLADRVTRRDGQEKAYARCPAHDDQNPSLSISVGTDGRVLLKCHAGCKAEDILSELGLGWTDLFPDNGTSRVVETYDYNDEDGILLFQVVRKEPKDFSQRRPDGRGGWLSQKGCMKGVRRVPYRLDQLLRLSEGRAIVVCEGEKDVHALEALEVAATTNPGGAEKWSHLHKPTVEKIFKNRQVLVIPDNDEAGRRHARQVAESLIAIASDVRIVKLPGLPEKGDVSDWIAAGGTRERLFDLAEDVEPFSGEETMGAGGEVNTVQEEHSSQNGRPSIRVLADYDLADMSRLAWEAIRAAGEEEPQLFRYAGMLARLERDDSGRLQPVAMNVDRMRHLLARLASWHRFRARRGDEGGFQDVPTVPPLDVVRDVLAEPSPEVPTLERVVTCPIILTSGEIAREAGYYPAGRIFADPEVEVGPIPESPTDEEIAVARDLLLDVIADFPFVGASDRAGAFAMMIEPVVRSLIGEPTPLRLIAKPTPGTGATLMVDVISRIAQGRAPMVIAEGQDEDEWRKRITAALLEGPELICIDNVSRRLKSASLALAITEDSWTDRILGASRMTKMPVRCLWVATGNNVELSNELVRRTVPIMLDARVERPWERPAGEFQHPDLRGWVETRRADLVAAALTIAQAWMARGRPAGEKLLGGFEAWSRVMGGICAIAGVEGLLGDLGAFYESNDAESGEVVELLTAWWQASGPEPVGVAVIWRLINDQEICIDLGSGSDHSRKTRLGFVLRSLADRIYSVEIDGQSRRLVVRRGGQRARAHLWRLDRIESEGVRVSEGCNPSRDARARAHAHARDEPGGEPSPTLTPSLFGEEEDADYDRLEREAIQIESEEAER